MSAGLNLAFSKRFVPTFSSIVAVCGKMLVRKGKFVDKQTIALLFASRVLCNVLIDSAKDNNSMYVGISLYDPAICEDFAF